VWLVRPASLLEMGDDAATSMGLRVARGGGAALGAGRHSVDDAYAGTAVVASTAGADHAAPATSLRREILLFIRILLSIGATFFIAAADNT